MTSLVSKISDHTRVKVSTAVQPFWQQCPDAVKACLQAQVVDINTLLSADESLLITQGLEHRSQGATLLFVVVNLPMKGETRIRFVLSFHAPEYQFYCANSDFRRCLVREDKWVRFAEPLIGFRHGLDR